MPVTHTEGLYLGDIVKFEEDGRYSRENVVILAGSGSARELLRAMVVGKVTLGAVSEDHSGNTGNGVMGTITLGGKAKAGDYVLTCIEAVEDGGVFQVVDPDGVRLADLTVAVAYAGPHLNMTLAAGVTDFAAGDVFTVTVAEGSKKVVQINFSATDGSQIASGILLYDATAPDGADAAGVALVRDAVVMTSLLVWPDGATEDQKTAALEQLAALGIIAAKEA